MIRFTLPDLRLRPTPMYELYAQHARRVHRRQQRRAWWAAHGRAIVRWTLLLGLLASLSFAVGTIVGKAMSRVEARAQAANTIALAATQREARAEDRALRMARLAASLVSKHGGAVNVRIAAASRNEAIDTLARMREALIADRDMGR